MQLQNVAHNTLCTKQNNQFLQMGPDFMNYYWDILLRRDLLPDIKQYSDYFTFQQDGAPAHRARETVELLKVETPDFIPPNLWPPNSPIWTQSTTRSGAYCKNGFTRQALRMSTSYDAAMPDCWGMGQAGPAHNW